MTLAKRSVILDKFIEKTLRLSAIHIGKYIHLTSHSQRSP